MFSLQKIITYILISTLVSTHTGNFVFAEEAIHSLEELPSIYEASEENYTEQLT